MRRASAFAASVFGVLVLAACGGGGGGGGGGTKTAVTGTAAQGAAIAGATLTLMDAAGTSRTATTATDGTFTIDTTGLTPPFMIKLVSGGTTLFSVSASADAEAVINITPLTDLILRSWYEVQDVSITDGFAAPASHPAPTPLAVEVIAKVVQQIVQLWLDQAGVSSDFNLISSPFDANGSGVDQVLDWTTVDASTGDVSISHGGTTQTTSLTYSTGDGSMSATTTTTGSEGTSSSTTTTVVPVGTAQQTALEAISTLVDQFAATVNAKGSTLAASDLTPYMDPDLTNDGWGRGSFAAFLAGNLKGATVSFAPVAVLSVDEVAGTAAVSFRLSMTQGSETSMELINLWFRRVSGSWLLSGDGLLAELELRTGMVVNQGYNGGAEGPILEVNVAAPEGTLDGVTVQGGPWATATALTLNSTKVTPGGNRDGFEIDDQHSITAGTEFSLVVTPKTGTAQTYSLLSNAVTSEKVRFSGLTATTFAGFALGTDHTMTWNLPKTFAVAFVRLGRVAYTGDPNAVGTLACETSQTLAASATTGTVNIPTECTDGVSGGPTVQAEVYVQAWGAAGEFTTAYYQLIESI